MSARPDHAAQLRRLLVDPVELARKLGLAPGATRQPRGVLVRCPAHSERNASCSITLAGDGTIAIHCFACNFRGDALTLIAKVEDLDLRRDFGRVLSRAADLAGVTLDDASTSAPRCAPRTRSPHLAVVPPPPEDAVAFDQVVAPILDFGRLDESVTSIDVTNYLAHRHLLDEARSEGFAALPAPGVSESHATMLLELFGDDAVRSGLVTRSGTFCHPDNRLCIPWRDPGGAVVTLQRRRIDLGEPRYVFPKGRAPRWPYGIEKLAAADASAAVVFVEGAVDVLAARALDRIAGRVRVVLGVPGVSAWRPEWATLATGRHAVVALDADAAGDAGARRVADDLFAAHAASVQRSRPASAIDWAEKLVQRARGAA